MSHLGGKNLKRDALPVCLTEEEVAKDRARRTPWVFSPLLPTVGRRRTEIQSKKYKVVAERSFGSLTEDRAPPAMSLLSDISTPGKNKTGNTNTSMSAHTTWTKQEGESKSTATPKKGHHNNQDLKKHGPGDGQIEAPTLLFLYPFPAQAQEQLDGAAESLTELSRYIQTTSHMMGNKEERQLKVTSAEYDRMKPSDDWNDTLIDLWISW